jgi:hypothetical protein
MNENVRLAGRVKNTWIRRLGYAAVLLVWLIVMAFPVFAFIMATKEEIQVGDPQGNHLRVFLLMEQDSQGIGLEFSRMSGHEEGCYQSSVRYFLWEGSGENATFCQCIDPISRNLLSSEQGRCH